MRFSTHTGASIGMPSSMRRTWSPSSSQMWQVLRLLLCFEHLHAPSALNRHRRHGLQQGGIDNPSNILYFGAMPGH